MEKKIILIVLLMPILFWGCMGSAYDKKLNGEYFLFAVDAKEDMYLGYQDGEYGIGVIDATVFAVGQSDDYIIVKQHPIETLGKLNKQKTNYYIIPLKERINKSVDKNFYGPFTKKEFEQKKIDLNLYDIEFDIIHKDLE